MDGRNSSCSLLTLALKGAYSVRVLLSKATWNQIVSLQDISFCHSKLALEPLMFRYKNWTSPGPLFKNCGAKSGKKNSPVALSGAPLCKRGALRSNRQRDGHFPSSIRANSPIQPPSARLSLRYFLLALILLALVKRKKLFYFARRSLLGQP